MLVRRCVPRSDGVCARVDDPKLWFDVACVCGGGSLEEEEVEELVVCEEKGVCTGCVGIEIDNVGAGEVSCEE